MKNCYLAFLKRHSQLGWKDELRGSAILFDHLVSAWDLLQKKDPEGMRMQTHCNHCHLVLRIRIFGT